MRLSANTLGAVAAGVRRPAYAPFGLGLGIVHLGVGAFHRAHQAVYTDDAIEAAGGDWGIIGISMRQPKVAENLRAQDGLYTVEQRAETSSYRIIGCLRQAITLPLQPEAVIASLAAASCRVVTLTITEKGYCLGPKGLDLAHADVKADIEAPWQPRSAIGALVAGLRSRRQLHGRPLTVISCDNLSDNGARLREAVLTLAERVEPGLAAWIDGHAAFPETMVDSIVPASDEASMRRCDAAIGMQDLASVQREPFAQWVIEDRFAGDRPAWDKVGVEIVESVLPFRQLKLHVLNASHSALAYLGLARGHSFVREAIRDPDLARFLDGMIAAEVAPALKGLDVAGYWAATRGRFANPAVDHRLDQIAQDGPFKLAQRVFPLMIANSRAGLPIGHLGRIVAAWLRHAGLAAERAFADPGLFPEEFRQNPALRQAVTASLP
jgi:fructuronate reductase